MLPIEAIAGALIVIIAAIIRSLRHPTGLLRKTLDQKNTAASAHEAIPQVVEQLEQIDSTVCENSQKLDDVEGSIRHLDRRVSQTTKIMQRLHEDDSVEVSVDDLDGDFFRSGHGDTTNTDGGGS